MPITKEQAVSADYGLVFHYEPACTPKRQERWRVNGACKVWKTRPDEFRLPIKHGLRAYSYLDETNAHNFHLESECEYAHS